MNALVYDALEKQITFKSDEARWYCDGIKRQFSKYTVNFLTALTIRKMNKLIKDINEADATCRSCAEQHCAIIRNLHKFTELRDCIDEVLDIKKDIIFRFLSTRLENVAEDFDNIIENYSIGADNELVNMVSSISAKFCH